MGSRKKTKRPTYPPERQQAKSRRAGMTSIPLLDKSGSVIVAADWFDDQYAVCDVIYDLMFDCNRVPAFLFISKMAGIDERKYKYGETFTFGVGIKPHDGNPRFAVEYVAMRIVAAIEGDRDGLIECFDFARSRITPSDLAGSMQILGEVAAIEGAKTHIGDAWITIAMSIVKRNGQRGDWITLPGVIERAGVKAGRLIDLTAAAYGADV